MHIRRNPSLRSPEKLVALRGYGGWLVLRDERVGGCFFGAKRSRRNSSHTAGAKLID
jgi:hypothetical protein